jgi:uncharacterized membrane protein
MKLLKGVWTGLKIIGFLAFCGLACFILYMSIPSAFYACGTYTFNWFGIPVALVGLVLLILIAFWFGMVHERRKHRTPQEKRQDEHPYG